MNFRTPHNTVRTTWLAMLLLQTVGTIDSQHKMPAPRQYVAVSVLWGILFLFAEGTYKRLAAQMSVLVLVTASIAGPFGKRLVEFFNLVGKQFPARPPDTRRGASSGPLSSGQGDSPAASGAPSQTEPVGVSGLSISPTTTA